MEILNIEARYKERIRISKEDIEKLPKKIALFSTVQFIDSISDIKKDIEKTNRECMLLKPRHSKYNGQLLGCGIEKFDADGFLFIGDGYFHVIALALKNNKPIFTYNPYSKSFAELDNKIVEKIKKRQKYSLAKFYSSEKIGILVSTKPGQNNFAIAFKLKDYLNKKGKKAYILVDSTINLSSLEDFSFIECFVNTACPRIAIDDYEKIEKPIINIDDILEVSEIKNSINN